MAEHNQVGEIGESTVANYLQQHGYRIEARNYNRKWGELDIIASRRDTTYFIEVKTNTRQSEGGVGMVNSLEKVDSRKLFRLARAIQTYALENGLSLESDSWRLDIYAVILDQDTGQAELEVLPNVPVPWR